METQPPGRPDSDARSACARQAHIALVMQDFGGGGAELMMLNLADGFVARGHHVDVVVVRAEGPFLKRVPTEARLVTLGPRRVSRAIPALARYLRANRPDGALSSLVHVNVATVMARALARVPTRLVLREENRVRASMRPDLPAPIRIAYRLLPWVYPRADHVVGVSDGVADELRSLTGLTSLRVHAVQNPALTARDFAAIEALGPLPHPWLGDSAIPVILSMGRLVPAKDHGTLLEAFAILRRDRPARLTILGDGPLRGELEEQARRLGIHDDVLFAGFTEDRFAWLARATAFAHTSRWEGFGVVIVEALACGLPVVATDCPSGPAEILDGGRFGRLVPVGDVQAIARALGDVLDSPPPRAALRARAARYTVDAVIPTYETLLLGPSVVEPPPSTAGR